MELNSEVLLENPELLDEFDIEQGYLDTANSNIENRSIEVLVNDDPAMDTLSENRVYGEEVTKEELAKQLLDQLRKQLVANPLDVDQTSLVEMIQQSRTFLLESAMAAYLNKPNSASLLEGVTSLISHMEKTVRDDRKERAKKKELEGNQLSFQQLLDAMSEISSGKIALPKFEIATNFILDPNQSLITEGSGIKPIKPAELVQGMQQLDIDGNAI